MSEFNVTTPQGRYQMSAGQVIDELTYINYAHNRKLQPAVTPEQWVSVYGPSAVDYEARLQREKTDEAKNEKH